MLETIYFDGLTRSRDEIMAEIEQKVCYMMLRMWAAELYSADGWTILQIQHKTMDANADILNLRPYNTRTRKFYRGTK